MASAVASNPLKRKVESTHPPGDPLYCYVCGIFNSSLVQKQAHEAGKKHRKKCTAQGIALPDVVPAANTPAGANNQPDAAPGGASVLHNGMNANFKCEVCNLFFSSYGQHVEHSNGRKHARNAKAKGLPVNALEWLPDQEEHRKRQKTGDGGGGGATTAFGSTKRKGKKKNKEEKYFNSLPARTQRNLTAYACKFLPLIELELQEEMQEAVRKLREYPMQKLMSDGVALLNLSIQRHKVHKGYFKKSPTEQVYKVNPMGSYGGMSELPNHDIVPGDVLWLSNDRISQMNPQQPYWQQQEHHAPQEIRDIVSEKKYIEAHCISRNRSQLVITVDPMAQPNDLYEEENGSGLDRQLLPNAANLHRSLDYGTHWTVMKGVSRISYDRMKDAVEKLVGMRFEGHSAFRDIVCRIKATKYINPMDIPVLDDEDDTVGYKSAAEAAAAAKAEAPDRKSVV